MSFYVLSNTIISMFVAFQFILGYIYQVKFEYNYHLNLQICRYFVYIFLLEGYELIYPTSSGSMKIH